VDWQYGFFWTSSSGMTRLGDSFPPTFANAISNTGRIVGENSTSAAPFSHAFSWKNGIATDLGTLGGADYASSANGVNDLGQIVGWSTTIPIFWFYGWCGTTTHAVLWSASGGISDLGTLPGDTLSAASNINFFGLVIGESGNAATCDYGASPYAVTGRSFIWTNRSGMRVQSHEPQTSRRPMNGSIAAKLPKIPSSVSAASRHATFGPRAVHPAEAPCAAHSAGTRC
jgi:probable HAF family extracellular repeat protein